MGELSMDSPLKSHELLETGEVNVLYPLWLKGLSSRRDMETGRA
jgi:hypothetical protein